MKLRCAVCGEALEALPKQYCCPNGHCFDRAKSGYVNLLLKQSSRTRGDDPMMVAARRAFLDAGYYKPLLDAIGKVMLERRVSAIADIGCGEGWYSCHLAEMLTAHAIPAELCGFDISADALRFAANRTRQMGLSYMQWAVASINRLPLDDAACDCILNLFAPCEADEFARILRPDGILIRAVPLERHLWQLKEAVYAQPYENRPVLEAPQGFLLSEVRRIETEITVAGENLHNLFAMTPYVRKTSPADAAKIAAMESLTTEIQFGLLICRKCP